jgi:hypothetical protein
MKKDSSLKKLKLHRETIRTLTNEEAKQAAGGGVWSHPPACNLLTAVTCSNCLP